MIGDALKTQRLNGFKRSKPLEQGLFKRASDRHHFADRLHLCAEHVFGARELFKRPLWYFSNDIIDSRLKRGRGFFGDVVGYFVERVAHSELGSDLCNWKTCGLRCEC